MNRRQFLGTTALGGITATAGCGSLLGDPTHTLWFIHIRNGMENSIDISVSTEKDDETVFSEDFVGIPGRDAARDDPSYADSDNVRFISGEWEPESANYRIGHEFYDDHRQQRIDEIAETDTEHVGIEISIHPGGVVLGYNLVPFESTAQVEDFFDEIGVDVP